MYSNKTVPAEIHVYTDEIEQLAPDALMLLTELLDFERRQIIARLKLIERILRVAKKEEQ